MKNFFVKHKIIIIVVVIVVIIGIVVLTSSSSSAATPGKGKGKGQAAKKSAIQPSGSSQPANEFPFKDNAKNDNVLDIQNTLVSLYPNCTIAKDSIWGPETAAALQKYYGKGNIGSADEMNAFNEWAAQQKNKASAGTSDKSESAPPADIAAPVPEDIAAPAEDSLPQYLLPTTDNSEITPQDDETAFLNQISGV